MSTEQNKAEMETSLALELETSLALEMASDVALRSLVLLIGRENAELCWKLGYVRGASDAYKRTSEIIASRNSA